MAVIKLGDLTTFTGDTSGSWFVMNDPTNTATYKVQRETLVSGSTALSASYSISSSLALTASYVDAANVVGLNLSQIASGSATASISPGLFNVNTDTNIGGDLTASNALFTGTITAQRLVTQVITSSTEFITGSTRFGSFLTDTHQFTGSISVTGSSTFSNGFVILQQVSQSLNFVDDAAAATGGVPLGGVYRSGNVLLIRMS